MSLNAFLQGLETNSRERTSLIAAIKREIGAPSQSAAKRPRSAAATSSAGAPSDGTRSSASSNHGDSKQIIPALNSGSAQIINGDNASDVPKTRDAKPDVAYQKVNMDKLKEDLISRKKEVLERLHETPSMCTADMEAYETYRARAWQEYYDNMDAWKVYFDEASKHN